MNIYAKEVWRFVRRASSEKVRTLEQFQTISNNFLCAFAPLREKTNSKVNNYRYYQKMKKLAITSIILLLTVLNSCQNSVPEPQTDWSAIAGTTSHALIENYWNEDQNYFNYQNDGQSAEFHYWPQAHALDVLLDAYSRTGDDYFLMYIYDWFEGVPEKNGGSFLNRYYDDMEWNALAMLRAYRLTGDEKFLEAVEIVWNDIQTGWNENAGGGLMWRKGEPYGKNACSNGPAAILAARLFRENKNFEDLEWAKRIYQWKREMLFDKETGAIWDNVKETDNGLNFNKDWIFTYNQGTFIAAAVELFDLTNDSTYLQDAIKATDYTLNQLSTADEILKSEGDGDGGLFKGIFIRYFTQLIQHHALPREKKQEYVDFLFHNAQTLWNQGTDKERMLFGSYWKTKPEGAVDLTIQLSGAMLMEAAAELFSAGYSQGMALSDFPAWSGNPVFEGWYADPEVIVYDNKYWIYPTYSAPYEEQVKFDCFSSPDLVNWTKHENIIDTTESIISCGRKAAGPAPTTVWPMPLPTIRSGRLSDRVPFCSRIRKWLPVPGIIRC
jgi:predicted alpha-1,6-mannanase (GH76 family)